MAQLPLVEMAEQGDEWAIAALLNQKLKVAGYTARVKLENTGLKVFVEAIELPNQQSTVAIVQRVLQRFSIAWVETIVLYGKAIDVPSPTWQQTLDPTTLQKDKAQTAVVSEQGSTAQSIDHGGCKATSRHPSLSSPLPPRSILSLPRSSTDFLKLGFIGFLALHAITELTATDYSGAFTFLHGVSLIIHEAGHTLFSISRIFGETFLGELIYFAGGSLLQIIVPAIVVGNFALTAQYYSAAIALYWVAQNFTDVAVYIKDASAMELPLLAEGLTHDWNYILGSLNLLDWDQAIGGFVHLVGVLLFVVSLLFGVFCVVGQQVLSARLANRRVV
jgi:hypothetical protein